jgi:hypothetical protein
MEFTDRVGELSDSLHHVIAVFHDHARQPTIPANPFADMAN